MNTPMGDFIRAKRDSIQPEALGLPARERRRAPGLRRSELAARAGISVEYLTRIEQGRDRNPSPPIVNSIADALSLDLVERDHLRFLSKISGNPCAGLRHPAPPVREVRPAVLTTLGLLEPGIALVTNRIGDVLAWTSGFEQLMREPGLFDEDEPNLTRYVFTDPRARTVFADWSQVADERAFDLRLGPSASSSAWFKATLAPRAGPEFTRRLDVHIPPARVPLQIDHPTAGRMQWHRETLDLPSADEQQIVVLLPVDDSTARAMEQLRQPGRPLRAVT